MDPLDALDPADYDDHMKELVKYGEDQDLVKTAIYEFLCKYPAIIHATLVLEHVDVSEDAEDGDSTTTGIMVSGDALFPEGDQDRLRGIRNCARYMEGSASDMLSLRDYVDKDE